MRKTSASITQCNNSFPSFAIQFLAAHLQVHIDRIRVETSDIGGSFGIKITSYPQMAVCALASRKAGGRPVKWVETRSEHITSSAHGNERTFRDTRVALDKNGVITAIASRHIDDCGAYPRYEPLGCVIWSQVFPGVYRFKNARIDFTQAVTNKCPVGPNRGYSRMQHLWFLERVVDICAHEVGNCCRRNASAQLHSHRRVSLHHAQRMHLRLGKLSQDARSRQTENRLGRMEDRSRQRRAKRVV